MRMFFHAEILLLLCIGCAHCLSDEECGEVDYLARCSATLQTSFQQAQSQGNATAGCLSIGTYIQCVEEVACECRLTGQSHVHNQLTYISGIYTYQGCPEVIGPLIMNKGIPCNVNGTGSSREGDLLVLSTAESEIVVGLRDICDNIQHCYTTYDTRAATALHARNLTDLCSVLKETITCLEHESCACGEGGNSNLTENVKANHAIYSQSCNIITPDILPKENIHCTENGTVNSICTTSDNPIYKCYLDLNNALLAGGSGNAVRCPALKTYIECTEDIACQCGHIRKPAVYRAVTVAAASFNDSVCGAIAGPLVVTSGMKCQDGSGTADDEDRLIIALSEDQSVLELDAVCPGIKACYARLDNATGIALFEKNIRKLCAGQKYFIECMEESYCQCGRFNYENSTVYLKYQRDNHAAACFTDSVLRSDFTCNHGSIGFSCSDNSDCYVVSQSECSSQGRCACKEGYIYSQQNPTSCLEEGSHTGSICSNDHDCHHKPHSECGMAGNCVCQTGYSLNNGVCTTQGVEGSGCSSNGDCPSGHQCNSGQCNQVSGGARITSLSWLFAGILLLSLISTTL